MTAVGGSPPATGAGGVGTVAEPTPPLTADNRASSVPPVIEEALPVEALGPGRLKSKNVYIGGKRTSLRLEPGMWSALEEIAVRENDTVSGIVARLAQAKDPLASVTGAVRAYIAEYFRSAATEEGHRRAGHGSIKGGSPLGLRAMSTEKSGNL